MACSSPLMTETMTSTVASTVLCTIRSMVVQQLWVQTQTHTHILCIITHPSTQTTTHRHTGSDSQSRLTIMIIQAIMYNGGCQTSGHAYCMQDSHFHLSPWKHTGHAMLLVYPKVSLGQFCNPYYVVTGVKT